MTELLASVVLDSRAAAVDSVFSYRIPPGLKSRLKVGSVVSVPFTKADRRVEGVVVGFSDKSALTFDTSRLKDIEAVLSDRPVFTGEMIALSLWMADYYMCSWGEALRAMLPATMSLSGIMPEKMLQKYCRLCSVPESAPPATKRQSEALAYLEKNGKTPLAELIKHGFSAALINKLNVSGYIKITKELAEEEGESIAEDALLSPGQAAALNDISENWRGERKPMLLFGVTGSGKTELYLRAVSMILNEGKGAILLVPEIALTPQMVRFHRRRLKEKVAVLHSGLTLSERREAFLGIAEGRYRVVLGCRSAVFAPVPDLGLIIIDEEHESTYKQGESSPRFDARTVAMRRAEQTGCLIISGSATPLAESYYAARSGRAQLITLPGRYHQAELPETRIVDMRAELHAGNRTMFSRALKQALTERLTLGEQSLLFLNRRAFYTFFCCRDCGTVIKCPHCAVPLSYHDKEGLLKCHYCGHERVPPQNCPECGSSAIRHFGTGTERVEGEIKKMFPEARVLRLDRDTVKKSSDYERVYDLMLRGEADILIGTQMIAKGLDFPRVTLAGVISADITLNLPDWRASERTFQLLTQLVGRAGRREKRGLALIQTYQPGAFAVAAAAKQDYTYFYEREIAHRSICRYPPFCRLVRLLVTGEDEAVLQTFCERLRDILCMEGEGLMVCGPAPAPLPRIRDRWRWQILIKTADLDSARDTLGKAVAALRAGRLFPKDIALNIDVDPINSM